MNFYSLQYCGVTVLSETISPYKSLSIYFLPIVGKIFLIYLRNKSKIGIQRLGAKFVRFPLYSFLWIGEGAIIYFILCLRIACAISRVTFHCVKLIVLNKVIGNYSFIHHMSWLEDFLTHRLSDLNSSMQNQDFTIFIVEAIICIPRPLMQLHICEEQQHMSISSVSLGCFLFVYYFDFRQ